jgi:predicted amidohydrolase YtcJ
MMMQVQSTEAVDQGLGAVERALARYPRFDHQHRREHSGDLPVGGPRLDRMAALGMVPVATP